MSIERKLLTVDPMELSSDNSVLDWLSGSNVTSGNSCERLCPGGPVDFLLGAFIFFRRGMACGDGEVGRGGPNRVSIRRTKGLEAVYQVNIDLSRWLELHGAVSI